MHKSWNHFRSGGHRSRRTEQRTDTDYCIQCVNHNNHLMAPYRVVLAADYLQQCCTENCLKPEVHTNKYFIYYLTN
jgi:hypothetical protein